MEWNEQSAAKNAAQPRLCGAPSSPLRSSGGRGRAQSGARAPPAVIRRPPPASRGAPVLHTGRQGVPRATLSSGAPGDPASLLVAAAARVGWRAALPLVLVEKCRAYTEKQFMGTQVSVVALQTEFFGVKGVCCLICEGKAQLSSLQQRAKPFLNVKNSGLNFSFLLHG